jgi:hypothetical protein
MAKRKKRRQRSPRNDQLIIDRLADGSLEVDLATGRVYSRWRKKRKLLRRFLGGREGSPYWFVRICHQDHRKAIAVARLVFIAGRWRDTGDLAAIEAGYEVHHVDVDPNNNAYDNLELKVAGVHQAEHNSGQYEYAGEGEEW